MYRASILCNQMHCIVIVFINSSNLNQISNVSTYLFKSYTSIGALYKKMCDYRKLSTIYSMFSPVLSWYPRDSLPTSVHTLGPRKSSTQVECQVNQQWERRRRYQGAPRRRQNRPRKTSWLRRRRQTSKLICIKKNASHCCTGEFPAILKLSVSNADFQSNVSFWLFRRFRERE